MEPYIPIAERLVSLGGRRGRGAQSKAASRLNGAQSWVSNLQLQLHKITSVSETKEKAPFRQCIAHWLGQWGKCQNKIGQSTAQDSPWSLDKVLRMLARETGKELRRNPFSVVAKGHTDHWHNWHCHHHAIGKGGVPFSRWRCSGTPKGCVGLCACV